MGEAEYDSVADVVSRRIVTVPNALSASRLVLIPVFIWVALGPENDLLAFVLLASSAVTWSTSSPSSRDLPQTGQSGLFMLLYPKPGTARGAWEVGPSPPYLGATRCETRSCRRGR